MDRQLGKKAVEGLDTSALTLPNVIFFTILADNVNFVVNHSDKESCVVNILVPRGIIECLIK